jgi:hypothetical protein
MSNVYFLKICAWHGPSHKDVAIWVESLGGVHCGTRKMPWESDLQHMPLLCSLSSGDKSLRVLSYHEHFPYLIERW